MNNQRYIAYFDGACEPSNPGGNMGIGAVIFPENAVGSTVLHEHSNFIPAARANSNNVAEYLGFKWLIQTFLTIIPRPEGNNVLTPDKKATVRIYGDSKLVIMQMNGDWRMKGGLYVKHAIESQDLLMKLHVVANVKLEWIPRHKNQYADDLSKRGMIKAGVKFMLQKQED